MFDLFLGGCLLFITLSILAAIYRVVKGPSMPDRVMALDYIGVKSYRRRSHPVCSPSYICVF